MTLPAQFDARPLAIAGATLLALEDGTVLPGMTVLIRGGAIEVIGRTAELSPPPDAAIIDGTGKFLLPGLCDMHVHIAATRLTDGELALDEAEFMARSRDDPRVFLAHGITTVRNMAGTPLHAPARGGGGGADTRPTHLHLRPHPGDALHLAGAESDRRARHFAGTGVRHGARQSPRRI